jgi:regulator of protease activity HflC (stomatin/prohibitin superfamily)
MTRLLWLLFVLTSVGCSIIDPGERGIRFHFGKASEEVQQPGAYIYVPFVAGMKQINVQVQKAEVDTSAASKDMQEIHTHVAVNWSIAPDKVVQIFKQIGDEDDILARIIIPAVNEALKQASAKRTAEEALTHRLELKKDIDEALSNRLLQYGVTLHDVSIVNFSFSKEFMDAIERKQIAEQKAKEAEYVAQQAVQDARAEVNRAKGRAEAQQLLRQTLTKEILQQRAIEKWDGKFPQFMGSQALPFINFRASDP